MSSASATVSATASATTTAAAALKAPGNLKVVGVILAIVSGLLIGSSFVFKKKGLLNSQKAAGEGVAYLKSPLWWTGMISEFSRYNLRDMQQCTFPLYGTWDRLLSIARPTLAHSVPRPVCRPPVGPGVAAQQGAPARTLGMTDRTSQMPCRT